MTAQPGRVARFDITLPVWKYLKKPWEGAVPSPALLAVMVALTLFDVLLPATGLRQFRKKAVS